MPTTATGFLWSDLATLSSVISLLLLVSATALFLFFSRRPVLPGADQRAFDFFARYPLAVIGAIALGERKTVGAREFIATLMNLRARKVLVVEYDSLGTASTICVDKRASGDLLPLEKEVVGILCHFAADDAIVHLDNAKRLGEEHKQEIDKAYFAWKLHTKAEARQSIVASRAAAAVQKGLLYAGYVLLVTCVLVGYLVAIMPSVPLLIAGVLIVALSYLMQNRLFIERGRIRELARWLNSLDQQDDIPTDRGSIQRLLEYACVFGMAEKVAAALKKLQDSAIVEEETAYLDFFKRLKAELYTDEWHF